MERRKGTSYRRVEGLESVDANSIIEKLAKVRTTVDTAYRSHVNRYPAYPDKAGFKEEVVQYKRYIKAFLERKL